MSEELKPCPFCGAPCRDGNFLHSPTCAINYFQNGVKVPDAAWNRRLIPEGYALIRSEPTEAVLEALFRNGCDLYDEELKMAWGAAVEAAKDAS